MRCGRANLPPIISQTVYHHISSPFSSKRLSLQENRRSSLKHKTNRFNPFQGCFWKKNMFPLSFLKLRSFSQWTSNLIMASSRPFPPPRRLPATLEGEGWTSLFWAEAENSVGFSGREKEWVGIVNKKQGSIEMELNIYIPIATDGCVLMFSSHQQEVEIGFLELVGFHANHSNIL